MTGRTHCDWNEFSDQFMERFGALEQDLMFEKFKQLKQITTMEHYLGQFEGLMEQLKEKLP